MRRFQTDDQLSTDLRINNPRSIKAAKLPSPEQDRQTPMQKFRRLPHEGITMINSRSAGKDGSQGWSDVHQ
jgi:hypothetical protein